MNNHELFDKRLKKPVVYRVKNTNEDITVEHLETYMVGKAELSFRAPNIVALFLSMSAKAEGNARNLYDTLIKPHSTKSGRFDCTPEGTVEMFNYFEHTQTAIILLYSAIESLVNLVIPDDYIIEEKTNRGTKEIWDKQAIERWKSTTDKLSKVLPNALKIKSPSTLKYWSVFKEFEQMRNDIIHVKKDSLINAEKNKKIIGLLMQESIFKKLKAGNDLVKDLSKLIPNHYEFPIMNDTETLIPIEIDSWESLGAERIR